MEYVCYNCGRRESVTTRKPKCDCGGLWRLDYTPPKFDLSKVDKNEWSMFRYHPFMGLYGDAWREVSPALQPPPDTSHQPGAHAFVITRLVIRYLPSVWRTTPSTVR